MAKGKRNHLISIAGFLVTGLIITFLFPREARFRYEYQQGKPWQHKDLVAPFDFPVHKTKDELEADRQRVKDQIKLYYRRDSLAMRTARNTMEDVLKHNIAMEFQRLTQSGEIRQVAPTEELKEIFSRRLLDKGRKIIDSVTDVGIIEQNDELIGKPEDYIVFVFVDQNRYEEHFAGEFYTLEDALARIRMNIAGMDSSEQRVMEPALINSLKNTITFDANTTARIQEDELANIPTNRNSVTKGQLIISKGEIINEEKFNMLESFQQEFNRQRGNLLNYSAVIGGQVVFVYTVLSFLYFFLVLFRQSIIRSFRRTFSILSLILIVMLLTNVTLRFKDVNLYIVPFTILPILVRSFYDTRLALFAHITTVMLCAYFAPNNYEFMVLQLGAGITSIFSFVNFRKRAQLFITVSLIFLCYAILFSSLQLMKDGTLLKINPYQFLWFFMSCFATLFAFPLIYIFEKVFGLFSDITLLELSDTNTALLHELSVKAPGTFQHSIQVANLAQAAIDEIGGNSLLVRTGALYHDIGKVIEPQYFIENQVAGVNPHDKLSFEESARKIIAHVEHGVEIAKKHRLPSVLVDFIRTHHGTQTVQYFYKNYIKSFPEVPVDISIFSYPGPIPFTKETAVLMMADSVEAASRSIHEPDFMKIDQLVEKIIDYQIDQGQLNNSDITLKDISLVKKIFKDKLMNIYHVRIEYPE